MLSYDRVRVSLRGIQYLQVSLTEVSKELKVQSNFPPIFERDAADLKKGIFIVPWDNFTDVPTLLFYPKYPLPPYTIDFAQNSPHESSSQR